MKINQIRLKNFRNYDSCQFIPDPHMNVIIGKNAQGKTNFWKASYCFRRHVLTGLCGIRI